MVGENVPWSRGLVWQTSVRKSPVSACISPLKYSISLIPLYSAHFVTSNFFFSPHCFNPFPKQQILDSSKLQEFADDNFEFGENGRKFSKRVENTLEKGEIARYEHFSFSHNVYKRLVQQTRKNMACLGKG